MTQFAGKTIMVTGAAGGIGTPLVKMLLEAEAEVIAVDVSEQGLNRLKEETGATARLSCLVSTLQDEAACKQILQGTTRLYGLVHLAGIFVPDDMAAGDTEAVYDPVMAANIRNLYSLYIAARPCLLEETGSRVVVASSLAFRRGAPWHVAYSAAKGALAGFIRSLARREAPHILFNGVAPGLIDTSMPATLIEKRGIDNVLAEIPMKRLGRPDEVASVIRFLLSDDSGYMTGQLLNIDGGMICS